MIIHIPASIADAVESLNGLDRLLKATEWERAAIVATFVDPGAGIGRPPKTGNPTSSSGVSIEAFAAHRINGFKSIDTIRRYVRAWLDERPRPLPGEVVDLDGLPKWPKRYGEEGTEKHGAARSPGQTAKALADPDFVETVVGKMTPDALAGLVEAIAKMKVQDDDDTTPKGDAPLPAPWSISRALSKVMHAAESLVSNALDEHPEGYGDSGQSHADAVGMDIALLAAFRVWLLDPSRPFADPTAEHFEITEAPLFVRDILGAA